MDGEKKPAMSVSQYGIPVAVKFSPAGIDRFNMLCLAKIRSGPKRVGFDTTSIGFRTPIFARRKRVGVSWRLTNRPQHTRREQVDTPPPGTFHRVLVKVQHLYAARS